MASSKIQRRFKKDFKIKKIISRLFREKDKGFYVYAKGTIKNAKGAARYIDRYVSRPAIAESRIRRYDGKEVTFFYERHEDGEMVEVTLSAQEFIKKVIRHVPDRQFKMVRYYGIYVYEEMQKALLEKYGEDYVPFYV